MNETPWYMRTIEPGVEDGSPERTRRTLESLASTASAEADATVAHLKNAEAQGVEINPSTRMAMGYANVARKAAAQLGDAPQLENSVSTEDITTEERMRRAYGA
ncbi:hypothetical protein [Streptomyces sp. BH104]|uniref:hypothetical protein n=1 Tax=Streptomyces sp. BH104 TaxID=3410407 RepID=UPI003BB7315B